MIEAQSIRTKARASILKKPSRIKMSLKLGGHKRPRLNKTLSFGDSTIQTYRYVKYSLILYNKVFSLGDDDSIESDRSVFIEEVEFSEVTIPTPSSKLEFHSLRRASSCFQDIIEQGDFSEPKMLKVKLSAKNSTATVIILNEDDTETPAPSVKTEYLPGRALKFVACLVYTGLLSSIKTI